MKSKMRILLGGGTGFIGRHLEKELLSRGHTVQIISRTAGKNRITWNELEKTSMTVGLPEYDALVNLSGENILNPFRLWNDSYKNDIYNSRIGTNKLLVELMSKAVKKPSVWVSAHAEGVYPRSTSIEYDESFRLDEERSRVNYCQRLCHDWEQSALLPDDFKDTRHVGIRIGVVIGKYGGFIQQAWWPFWFGLGGTVGNGTQVFSWVHINDCTNLFVHAIENEKTVGYLNAVSPGTCTSTNFTKAFGKALNRPTFFPVPEFAIKFVFGPDRSPLLLEGSRIKPAKAIASGFKFEFPNIDKAMENIVNS